MLLITARIRRMEEDNIFSLFVSPHQGLPGLWSQVPSQGLLQFRLAGGGTPVPTRGYPSHVQGVPQFQLGGTPVLARVSSPRWGYPRTGMHPARAGLGYPCKQDWGTPPLARTGPETEYLLCGEWYASYGHAGGLSRSMNFYTFSHGSVILNNPHQYNLNYKNSCCIIDSTAGSR